MMLLLQALVQYPDDATAGMAKQYLDGHHMYPGGKNRVSRHDISRRAACVDHVFTTHATL
jgi:hypothetical protein